jgi:hypothetical protein
VTDSDLIPVGGDFARYIELLTERQQARLLDGANVSSQEASSEPTSRPAPGRVGMAAAPNRVAPVATKKALTKAAPPSSGAHPPSGFATTINVIGAMVGAALILGGAFRLGIAVLVFALFIGAILKQRKTANPVTRQALKPIPTAGATRTGR